MTAKLVLYFLELEGIITSAIALSLSLNILLIPLVLASVILPIVLWASEEFIVREKELVVKRGVISTKLTAFPFTNMQRIELKQGLLGKMFNFGTVSVYVPVLGQEISFRDLANPQVFAELLKQSIPQTSHNHFLLRKN